MSDLQKKHFFIHATNIHQGGGRSLLDPLIRVIGDQGNVILTLDNRMPVDLEESRHHEVKRVKATIIQRILAERWLAGQVTQKDKVLCFGNLPPLFKLRGYTSVFLQNRYLIDDVKLTGHPLKIRLRITLERIWLVKKMANVNEFIVQTPTMKRLLEAKTQGRVPIQILPFVANPDAYQRNKNKNELVKQSNLVFIYIASGEPHKNHLKLLEAWGILAREGYFPELKLTFHTERYPGLSAQLAVMSQKYDVKIKNLGELSHHDVLDLYKKADAVIYPSTFESFGLPLIEARQAGLPVLASELDYVRDVIDPEQTFDPISAISIAKAVKRFAGQNEEPLPIMNATDFFRSVFC